MPVCTVRTISKSSMPVTSMRSLPMPVCVNAMSAEQGRYKDKPHPLHGKTAKTTVSKCYRPADFFYDPAQQTCLCPAGKRLYRHGNNCRINGYVVVKFEGAQRDCLPCS